MLSKPKNLKKRSTPIATDALAAAKKKLPAKKAKATVSSVSALASTSSASTSASKKRKAVPPLAAVDADAERSVKKGAKRASVTKPSAKSLSSSSSSFAAAAPAASSARAAQADASATKHAVAKRAAKPVKEGRKSAAAPSAVAASGSASTAAFAGGTTQKVAKRKTERQPSGGDSSNAPPRKALKPSAMLTTAAAPAASVSPPASAPAPARRITGATARVTVAIAERAAQALLTHLERRAAEKRELLAGAEPIFLVVATKKMPKEKVGTKGQKPVRLPLPHPWRSLEDTEVTLIVKDPQRVVKDKLAEQQVRAKVIGIDKLRKKYVEYEARRRLMTASDILIADDRVLPMLPPLLGSQFFKANKLPLALNIRKRDLRGELERCVGGAVLRPTNGTCSSLTVANSSLGTVHIAENVVAASEQIVQRVGGWGNVQSMHVRAANTVSLPIYNSVG